MIRKHTFVYQPQDHESEKASNSYLMSLVALIGGLPLPILNLLATFIFYMSNRKGTYFVRWHCTQALVSQFSMLFINSTGFWWTVAIIFTDKEATNPYFAYLITAILFNITEFVVTIYTAIQTRKGNHVVWWFYGPLTQLLCRPER